MKPTTLIFNEAIERMVLSLEPKHWQAIAAETGIPYPNSLSEKIKLLKKTIKENRVRKGDKNV